MRWPLHARPLQHCSTPASAATATRTPALQHSSSIAQAPASLPPNSHASAGAYRRIGKASASLGLLPAQRSHGAFVPCRHSQGQPARRHACNGRQPRHRALRRHRNQTNTPTLPHAPAALAAPTHRPLHIAQRRQQPHHRALRSCRIAGTCTQPPHSNMPACASSHRVPYVRTGPAVALA